MSRRAFLKAMSMAGAAASLGGVLPAFASAAQQDKLDMSLWWWADDPAFGKWVTETAQKFTEKNPNITIKPLQQATDSVISQFTAAAAAKQPPDVQFFFNGIYHMENVWLGYIEPLNDLIAADVLADSNATALSVFGGKQYRLGWYPTPMIWEYNKDTWDKAKLDADNPPKTWDAWLAACDKLKTAGFNPMGGGLSDGFWGEWYLGHALNQALDNPGEAIGLFIGDKDFKDPKYYEFWSRLEDMVKAKFLNDDMLSVSLFDAANRVVTGELATTQVVGSIPASHIPKLKDRIGLMVMPIYGKGKLAGVPVNDMQGWGIPSEAKHKKESAEIITYMQDPERVNAFWEMFKFFPGNKKWDASVINDPVLKQMYDTWVGGKTAVYIPDLMPTQFWTDAMFVAAQQIVGGKMTGEQAGEQNAGVVKQWRTLNPDIIEKYQQWAEELGKAV
jgi:multiple sugar transport system substrate-binding protein